MNSRTFVRRGLAGVTSLIAMSALLACGSDSPTENGNGNGDDAPTLSSISPTSGTQGSTVEVTLTGSNFDGGNADVSVSGSGVTPENVSVGSSTSITADFVIGDQADTGDRNVTVSTDAGTSGNVTFTVESAPVSGSLTVNADDNFFDPSQATITTGTTVTWENVGAVDHTVTADGHSRWDEAILSPGESFEHTFDEVGAFDYVCRFHAGMDGSITVVDP
ncbi:MAG: plastocyanin/azurin family copper-binding protein [Gemmatimonadota bacterium]